MAVVAESNHHRGAVRSVALAGLVSVVTMPLTAMWFLLAGAVLLVGGLLLAALGTRTEVGRVSFVGLGLLLGPAIYISLALVQ